MPSRPSSPPAKAAKADIKSAAQSVAKPPVKPVAKSAAPAANSAKKVAPKAARAAWVNAAFITGVVASTLLHAGLLAMHFTMPSGGKIQRDRGLDVVLVNAKHARSPKEAQALAQANMDGGGNSEQKELASTPLPPEHTDQAGDALVEAQRKIEALEARSRDLLHQAQGKASVEATQNRRTEAQIATEAAKTGDAQEDKTRAIAKQEAVVDKLLRQYAQRPRKSVVGARTKEWRFALYAEAWRKAVEEVGTLKFPKDSGGKPIYGSVMLLIDIDRQGKLMEVKVERSSGIRKLDEAALQIVRMAAPFKPFPPDIARDTDILELPRTFVFQQTFGEATLDVTGGYSK